MSLRSVFGIAGGSCSGKSTLAKLTCEALGVAGIAAKAVGLDGFYTRDLARGPLVELSDGSVHFNFNHPDAIDWEAAVAAIRDEESGIVVVEGLFVLAVEEFRAELTGSVFLDVPPDVRALRRMLRDIKGGRASTDPEFIARYYLECARIGHNEFVEPSRRWAGCVVQGDDLDLKVQARLLARQWATAADA